MENKFEFVTLTKLGRCLFAGLWFAVAGSIPVAYCLFRLSSDGLMFVDKPIVLKALVPIILSGFMGWVLGANILDSDETKSGFKAIWLGFSVITLPFIFLFFVASVLTVFESGDIFGTIAGFVVLFFYGLLLVGWLVGIIGVLAGLLLYLLREKFRQGTDS